MIKDPQVNQTQDIATYNCHLKGGGLGVGGGGHFRGSYFASAGVYHFIVLSASIRIKEKRDDQAFEDTTEAQNKTKCLSRKLLDKECRFR